MASQLVCGIRHSLLETLFMPGRKNRVNIPKPGKDDYHESASYRTISITSCIGKDLSL